MNAIKVSSLTKDFGNNKGIFDLSFSLEPGEAVGFLGSNGAGKTTTLRHLMGFIKPDSGSTEILNMDCFENACSIQKKIGYLPGEAAFMDNMTGKEMCIRDSLKCLPYLLYLPYTEYPRSSLLFQSPE